MTFQKSFEYDVRRLQIQSDVLSGLSRRLIQACGISSGMRVLDFGCGAGDIALLLSQAVGSGGTVIAADREQRAIESGRRRLAELGVRNVDFVLCSHEGLIELGPFDAVISRFVLVHQPHPAAVLRKIARSVSPGGSIGFHETNYKVDRQFGFSSELSGKLMRAIINMGRASFHSADVAARFVAIFADAGLPEPRITWESIVGGPHSIMPDYLTLTYLAFLPVIEKLGLSVPEAGDPETLIERIRSDAIAQNQQFVSIPQVCAWVRKPL